MDNKADLNIVGCLQRSPFHMIFDSYLSADFKNQKNKLNFIFALKILLNYGSDINSLVDSQGNTILMLTVSYYKIDLIKILLCEKINIFIKDNNGENVFDKINKLERTDAEKKELYDILVNYKYNDSIFYLFEYTDINIFFKL